MNRRITRPLLDISDVTKNVASIIITGSFFGGIIIGGGDVGALVFFGGLFISFLLLIFANVVTIFLEDDSIRRQPSDVLWRSPSALTASAARAGLARSVGWTSDFRWRLMRAAARLMPAAAGKLWLEVAEGILFEAGVDRRRGFLNNYVFTAPRVIAVSWVGATARLSKAVTRGPTSR